MNQPTPKASSNGKRGRVVIQMTVHNHPGVMSAVSDMFAKRGLNLEGIAALPLADGKRSRVWLSVGDDRRLELMVKQIQKNRDVIEVKLQKAEHEVFTKLEDFFKEHPEERPASANGEAAAGKGARQG